MARWRRFTIAMVIAATGGLFLPYADAGTAYHSVSGSGKGDGGFFEIAITAHDGPTGVTGKLTQYNTASAPAGGFSARITCLSVQGNRAYVAGVITSATGINTALRGTPVSYVFEDNGEPVNGQAVDRWDGHTGQGCPDQSLQSLRKFYKAGNVVVR